MYRQNNVNQLTRYAAVLGAVVSAFLLGELRGMKKALEDPEVEKQRLKTEETLIREALEHGENHHMHRDDEERFRHDDRREHEEAHEAEVDSMKRKKEKEEAAAAAAATPTQEEVREDKGEGKSARSAPATRARTTATAMSLASAKGGHEDCGKKAQGINVSNA